MFLITIQFLVSITTKRHLQGKCTMDEEEIWWDHWSLWLMDRVAWCVKNNQFYFLRFPSKLMRLAAPIVCSSPLSWDPSHHKIMSKGDKTPSNPPALDHFNNDKLLHINTYWRRHYLIKRYCGLSAWAHKALNPEIHYVPRKLSIPKSASSPQIVCL